MKEYYSGKKHIDVALSMPFRFMKQNNYPFLFCLLFEVIYSKYD